MRGALQPGGVACLNAVSDFRQDTRSFCAEDLGELPQQTSISFYARKNASHVECRFRQWDHIRLRSLCVGRDARDCLDERE
jgi:hypothetical protein